MKKVKSQTNKQILPAETLVLWLRERDVLENEPKLCRSTFIMWYLLSFSPMKINKTNCPTFKLYPLISFGTLYAFTEDISAGVQWS